MRGQGHQIFVDELARFAAGVADARVTTIAESAAAPLRVAVRGRAGVGRSTVARALDGLDFAGRNMAIRATESDADVMVYVTTEVLKPEDAAAIAAARRPVVLVLNKADLAGFAGDGPVAATRARCAHIAGLAGMAGVPVEPMIGLLAVAGLGDLPDEAWAALRGLAAHPGGAFFDTSFDGFLAAAGPVATDDRLRLLDTLDMFGTALAVAAVRNGATPTQLCVLLRRVSCVDAVLAKINAVGAEVRYRRVLDAVAALEALAVSGHRLGRLITEFLAHDDTVLAQLAAATDLAQAVGLEAGPAGGDDHPAQHLSRALRWQRLSLDGQVRDVHRACAVDITRGSLRLWSLSCCAPAIADLGDLL